MYLLELELTDLDLLMYGLGPMDLDLRPGSTLLSTHQYKGWTELRKGRNHFDTLMKLRVRFI